MNEEQAEQEPASVEVFGAEYQKARRRRIVAVLAMLGVGVAALVGGAIYQRRVAAAKAADAYSELTQCLFGGPAPEGDAAAVRFRAGQLAAMGMEETTRAPVDKVAWPKRCGYRAQELLEAAKSAGYSSREQKDLPYWADQLAAVLKSPQGHSLDASEPLLAVLAEAEKHGLRFKEGKELGPPVLPPPLTIDDLRGVLPVTKKAFALRGMELDSEPSARRHFLVTDRTVPEAPLLCALGQESLHCNSLPEPLPSLGHALSLLGTAAGKGSPLIAAGQNGEAGVYRADTGAKVFEGYSYGAHVFEDGTVVALTENKKSARPFVLWATPGKAPEKSLLDTDLEVGSYAYSSSLVFGQLVLRGLSKADAPDEKAKKADDEESQPASPRMVRAEVRVLDHKAHTVGPAFEAGTLGSYFDGVLTGSGNDKDIFACSVEGRTSLLFDQLGSFVALVFADGRWASPLRLPAVVTSKLNCDAQGMGWSSIAFGREEEPWELSVRQVRCNSTECAARRGSMKELLVGGLELAPRGRLVDSLPLGEEVMLAWVAGERGGVRVRIAAADKLASAADIVVFDDLSANGKVLEKSLVSDLRLVGGPGFAILFLATDEGVFAIRVQADGKFSPMAAARD